MAPPARIITVALDMSKAFDTINIHTLIRKLLQKTFQAQSLSSSQTTSRDAKPIQRIEITHPNNVNLKLAFHKVASFHPHYLTFTPQTYHHPVHWFRSWPMQTTSQLHPHTQVRVQPRNTYNHTYTKFFAWTKQNSLLLNPDKTTCGNIGLPPLVRVMGVGRQQQDQSCDAYSSLDITNDLYRVSITWGSLIVNVLRIQPARLEHSL